MNSTLPADLASADPGFVAAPATIGPFLSRTRIAYFSMEIALEAGMPTYSGGLGVLAGDTIRSAADLKVPMVAVTLIYRKGYFRQRLDPSGWQIEEPVDWVVENFLSATLQRAAVTIEGRTIHLRAWKYESIRTRRGKLRADGARVRAVQRGRM